MKKEMIYKLVVLLLIVGGVSSSFIILRYTDITGFVVSSDGKSINISEPEGVSMKRGESKQLSVAVKNIGSEVLRNCKITGIGDNKEFISSQDIKDIDVGQREEFEFILKVPDYINDDELVGVVVRCDEKYETTNIRVFLIGSDEAAPIKPGLLGRAIFVEGGGMVFGGAVLAVLFVLLVIYIVKKLIQKPLTEDRAGYVKIKLSEK